MTHIESLSSQRRAIATTVAVALFAAITALRIVWDSNGEPLLMLNVVPVALLAAEFGIVAGTLAGAVSFATSLVYIAIQGGADPYDPTLLLVRGVVSIRPGLLIGWLADKEHAAQRASAERERQLRFIAQESSDMISTHSLDGRYRFISDRCRALTGYEPQELVGRLVYELIHPDDHEVVAASHAKIYADDAVTSAVYRISHKQGQQVWVESTSRLRRDSDGAAVAIHCATRDVTAEHLRAARAAVQTAISQERIDELLASARINVAYQPIKDLSSGRTITLEALARFATGAPDEWFAEAWAAERGIELELLAIRSAVDGIASHLPGDCLLAVNASPATVQSAELIDALGPLADRAVVEVTEHAGLTNPEAFMTARARLREHGVQLAIDDVGAGFSGLQRLLDFDPDMIKLDLSLSRGIDTDPRRQALASALIAFGERAGIRVVAEGIETPAELRALRALGVGYGRWYHLGRPAALKDSACST